MTRRFGLASLAAVFMLLMLAQFVDSQRPLNDVGPAAQQMAKDSSRIDQIERELIQQEQKNENGNLDHRAIEGRLSVLETVVSAHEWIIRTLLLTALGWMVDLAARLVRRKDKV